MISEVSIAGAVESRFQQAWDDERYPVSYDNVVFDSTNLDYWVRLTINNSSDTSAIGELRTVGIITVECFCKINLGTRDLKTLAQTAADIFGYMEFDGVRCQAPSIERQGIQGDWYKLNVYINFWFDESI